MVTARLALASAFGCLCLLTPSAGLANPKFLTLPFFNNSVQIQQGAQYTDGTRHLGSAGKGFPIDYVLGTVGGDPTLWASFDVLAAADGLAIRSSQDGYGELVLIKHDIADDQGRVFFTLYAHLQSSTIPSGIPVRDRHSPITESTGRRVIRGEFLGRAGDSGDFPCGVKPCIHLHFEVFRGGYVQAPIDPYDISREGDLHARADYPPGAVCGSDPLWTQCPPTTSGVVVLPPPTPQFDFAVSFVSIDGNVFGRGNPDDVIDFLDNFNDGTLTRFPTSGFSSFSPIAEDGGFLRLRSSDGANNFTPGVLVDNMILGQQNSAYRLTRGLGSSEIIAAFRADVPTPGQGYGLQLFTFGTTEIVNIGVGNCGGASCVTANYTGSPPASRTVPLILSGVQFILLRLELNNDTDEVKASFSTNGGSTYTAVSLPTPGRVFTSGGEAVVSLFGAVQVPQ